MNQSTTTRLNNKHDIIIHAGTIQNFSGDWLKMTFDMSTNDGVRRVQVKAKESITHAISRVLNK